MNEVFAFVVSILSSMGEYSVVMRLARRTQKQLKAHIDDKNAHKA